MVGIDCASITPCDSLMLMKPAELRKELEKGWMMSGYVCVWMDGVFNSRSIHKYTHSFYFIFNRSLAYRPASHTCAHRLMDDGCYLLVLTWYTAYEMNSESTT